MIKRITLKYEKKIYDARDEIKSKITSNIYNILNRQ